MKKIFNQKGYYIVLYDDYLPENDFLEVYEYINNENEHSWNWNKQLNSNATEEWQFQFGHQHIYGGEIHHKGGEVITEKVLSPYIRDFELEGAKVSRSRTNLFIRTKSFPFSVFNRGMGYHRDTTVDGNLLSLLLYLEDSDGGTQFKDNGRIIRSKRNRAIVFPAYQLHQTVMQTNTLYRTNININFK